MKLKIISLKEIKKFFGHVSLATPMEVEQAEQTFYINYLRPGMTVFDIGANIGEMSLLFSRFVGTTGKVHAFEASKSTFEKLKIVCGLAMRSQIVLNYNAVANQEGIMKLHVYDEDHSGWNSLADRPLEKYGIDVKPTHIEEVKSITIDSYCEQNNIEQIDLLKIDVEGAEYQVLLGSRKMLETQSIRCCVFEFGQTTFDMGNNPQQIKEYLENYGYKIQNVVKGNPIFPMNRDTAYFSVHVAKPR